MKIKIKQQDQKMMVKAKVPRGTKIDMGGIDFFRMNVVRGLFSPIPESVKSNSVEFVGPVGIPLDNYLAEPKSRDEYYKVIMQTIDLADRLQKQGIPLGYVNFDPHQVFINLNTTELYFIFLPVMAEPPMVDLRVFLDAVSSIYIPNSQEGDNARNEILFMMGQQSAPDMQAIENVIRQRAPEVVRKVRRLGIARTSASGFVQSVAAHPHDQGAPVSNMGPARGQAVPVGGNGPFNQGMNPGPMGSPNMNQMNQPPANGMFMGNAPANGMNGMNPGMNMGNPNMNAPMMNGMSGPNFNGFQNMNPGMTDPTMGDMPTGIMETPGQNGGMEESDETMVVQMESSGMNGMNNGMNNMGGFGAPVQQMQPWCHLIRSRTQERIVIDHLVFRLGREKTSDYQIRGNSAVGRSHADLIIRDHACFVVDRNSMNKTYINNVAIRPMIETPINNGDHLRLADEDFVFQVIM